MTAGHPVSSRPAKKGRAARTHQPKWPGAVTGGWETEPSSHRVPGEMRWAQGLRVGLGRAAQGRAASRDRVKSAPPASLPLLEMDPWFQNDSASPLNLYFTSEKLCIMQIVR